MEENISQVSMADQEASLINRLNTVIKEVKAEDSYLNSFEEILVLLNYYIFGGHFYFEPKKLNYENLIKIKSTLMISSSSAELKISSERVKNEKINKELELKKINERITNFSELIVVCEKVIKFADIRNKLIHNILDKNIKSSGNTGLFTYKLLEFIIEEAYTTFKTSQSDLFDEVNRVSYLSKLLYYNLAIAEEEESLTCNLLQIDKLIRIQNAMKFQREKFKETSSAEEQFKKIVTICQVLEDKISFLKKKVNLRELICSGEELTFEDKKEFEYINIAENGEDRIPNYYDEFYKKSVEFHVEKKKSFQKRPITINQQKGNFNSDTEYTLGSCEDIWKWSRHLRKRLKEGSLPCEEALEDIEIVLKVIKIRINELENNNQVQKIDFQSFAYRSAYNLLFNTSVKIELQLEVTRNFSQCLSDTTKSTFNDITFIRNLFNKIKDKQDDVQIYDYYPYQALLYFFRDFTAKIREDVFCLGLDKEKLDEKNESENSKKIESKIILVGELYEDAIKLFQKNLKWSKSKKWNPIYLERESSIIDFKDEERLKLFIDSSFVLPDNFEKTEEKWYAENQYRMVTLRSTKNRAQFEIHRLVTEASVDRKKEEFEKKVKENEFKVVQIVAMFVTIATFVLTNVKIFENKSLSASLAVMFAFAACMLLFNAFFKWLIRDSILVDLIPSKSVNMNKKSTGFWQQFTLFFNNYKYSFTDAILLGLIITFGLVSGYYRHIADGEKEKEDIKKQETINTFKDEVVEAYSVTLDSLNEKSKEKYQKLYVKDSLKRAEEFKTIIKEMVESKVLKSKK